MKKKNIIWFLDKLIFGSELFLGLVWLVYFKFLVRGNYL